MRTLLIHLSDIHFKTNDDEVLSRIAAIKNAIRDQIVVSQNVFIVVSGDVVFSGKRVEYDVARHFFTELEKQIKLTKDFIKIDYIVVPGNHDCDFALHKDMRELIIRDIGADATLLEKTDIVNECVKPQKDYFAWASSIQSVQIKNIPEKFVLQRIFNLSDSIKVKFLAYNTAWLSLPEKGHGGIVFPVQFIPGNPEDNTFSLIFSVLHHPYSWIEPEASKAFREVIEQNSNIIITGHEHDASYYEIRYLHRETRQYIPGGVLQGDEKSVFNTLLLDVLDHRMQYTKYTWQDTLYKPEKTDWLEIPPSRALKQDKYVLEKGFIGFLMESGVPFSHSRKSDLTINDIYVFPDLEEFSGQPKGSYINSDKALNYLLDNDRVIIFGPENSGKSSLLRVMFTKYQRRGITSLWIDGKDINTANPEKLKKLFKKMFESAYGNQYWEDYWQLQPDRKALIIDDFQESGLNRKTKLKLFDFIDQHFATALISTSNIYAMREIIEIEKNDFLLSCKHVALSEFGSVARNKLIEKWLRLGQEETIDEAQLDNKMKEIDEKARVILKPSIAPSYPFYILTITQSVDNASSGLPTLSNEDRGSFGFFYEWLITSALHRAPNKIADLNAKYRYLSELAYYMFESNKVEIDLQELGVFHTSYLQKYSLRFIDLSYEDMIADLKTANIFILENGYFKWRYPCIYYYFVARAFNSRLQQPKSEKHVKDIILDLINEIDQEENESILLFLSYLSENPYIRDTLLQAAKQMFSHNEPAELNKDLNFTNKDNFSLSLALPEEPPKGIRRKIHEQEDKDQKRSRADRSSKNEVSIDEQLESMMRANKIVRIMGQIVKNFATSWEGVDKYPLVEESYLLGLRVLKEILTIYAQNMEEFFKEIKDTARYKHDKEMLLLSEDRRYNLSDYELEQTARATLFLLTFLVTSNCVYSIAKHVGSDKLYPTYRDILEKHSSLISVRMIDIAIKLECQYLLPLDSMAELLKDLKHNPVGEAILQRLAYHRITLYEADRVEKQRCCQMLRIRQDDPRFVLSGHKIGKT